MPFSPGEGLLKVNKPVLQLPDSETKHPAFPSCSLMVLTSALAKRTR